ncbi:MAG: DUF3575 domain-containing protein [Muribaculaceae bacterium]|nr:DUF3575 domain-containing protein [Muribaculaceae bacterium]
MIFHHTTFRLLYLALISSLSCIGAYAVNPEEDPVNIAGSSDSIINFRQQFNIESDRVVSSPELRDFASCVDSIMRVDTITKVSVTGIASIDGPESLNRRLAKARAAAMSSWLQSEVHIPDSIISTFSRGEDWTMFRSLVDADSLIPARGQVITILDSKISYGAKEARLRNLDKGRTWSYLAKNVFPLMRCAEVSLGVKHRFIVPVPEEILQPEIIEAEVVEEIAEVPDYEAEGQEISQTLSEEWRRRFYIKTDLPYWLMTWANASFEVDLASHWSFNLPIYYSALNYFKHTIKFRIFGFQPGFRYWFRPDNMGAYLEVHYGMAWYDFAFNGEYRYQDYRRKTPAIGGGLAAGYRIPVSKNGRWVMEFGAGIGAYRLHYNRFINEYNGKLVDSKKKTYFGLDNLNISIGYTFPIEKRKGGGK